MKKPSSRAGAILGIAAAPVAVIVAGLLVWQGSNAAFTARTQNVGNNWATGSVVLSDDDAGAAGFQLQDLTPGDTGSKCIRVTSTSTVTGEVRSYISRIGLQGLESYIIVQIEEGTGGSFASCTGFVSEVTLPSASFADAAVTNYDYATGYLPWVTSGVSGETKTYKLTWTFDTTGLTQTQIDALQGKSVSADFIWELQSN